MIIVPCYVETHTHFYIIKIGKLGTCYRMILVLLLHLLVVDKIIVSYSSTMFLK